MSDTPSDTTDEPTDDLPDFEDFQQGDDSSGGGEATNDAENPEGETVEDSHAEPAETGFAGISGIDPLAEDFQIGDPVVDLANGRSMVVVDRDADRVDEWIDENGYDLLDNYGNERLRALAADPVYECVYVSSVSSRPSKSYSFPSSRLGRAEYENVDGVDRVYDMVARDVLERVLIAAHSVGDADHAEIVEMMAYEAGVDEDVIDEAVELAEVEVEFGGPDDA